ncbi:MAG: arginine repressor [Oscillospiraceae bacterium]|nr:arginine repressor [Oscillospiraceae bacterium]
MKNARHTKILELIAQYPIDRQEDLLEYLKKGGYHVTQATVSRDIRELGLVKTAAGDGGYRYVVASGIGKPSHTSGRFETIFRESVLKVDYAANIVLVKCYTAMANAACEVFDSMAWNGVVGTLSGDDTFMVLLRSEKDAVELCAQLTKYIKQ